jgi:hypothetical protein
MTRQICCGMRLQEGIASAPDRTGLASIPAKPMFGRQLLR